MLPTERPPPLPSPQVNKVAGNFHFAPGRSYQQGSMHVHDIAPFGEATLDFTHTIHKLSFGKAYPGMKNPLDGVKGKPPKPSAAGSESPTTGMYQYFLKVGRGQGGGEFHNRGSWLRASGEGLRGDPSA